MAISRNQTTGKFRSSNAASASGSFGALPTAGDLIVVAFWGYFQPFWAPSDCTDNQGNTYYLVSSTESTITTQIAIWACVTNAPSGTFTVTINPDRLATFYGAGCATSWTSTVGWGSSFDQSANDTGVSTAPSTGTTGTLQAADELVVASVSSITLDQASITVESVSPAWTEDAEELSWTSYIPGEMNSRIVTATTAQSCSWTLASSATWVATVATFREAGSGAGGAFSFASA